MNSKIPLVVVAGPTASGKTDVGIAICRQFHGEVVSADSMQIYQHLTVGTAKPTLEEQQGIPHHLMDFLPPSQSFSVAEYVSLARKAIKEIYSRGKLPVVVGGTGLYISSLVDNIQFSQSQTNEGLRQELGKIAAEQGNEFLWQQLAAVDPKAAQAIHPNNVGRVIRALEFYQTTGKTISQQQEDSKKTPSPYQPHMIGLNYKDRELLYQRIDLRVELMLENGLENEARWLMEQGYAATASQAIGYKEMFDYLQGKEPLSTAIEKIQQGSRRYAKRQLTWFRKDPRIQWFFPDIYTEKRELVEDMQKYLANRLKMC